MPWPGFEPGCLAALPPQSGGHVRASNATVVHYGACSGFAGRGCPLVLWMRSDVRRIAGAKRAPRASTWAPEQEKDGRRDARCCVANVANLDGTNRGKVQRELRISPELASRERTTNPLSGGRVPIRRHRGCSYGTSAALAIRQRHSCADISS
jgi:hypothetical protein